MELRKPRLLRALNALYEATAEDASIDPLGMSGHVEAVERGVAALSAVDRAPHVPWLNLPEDSWL
jgi:hypothetical protein